MAAQMQLLADNRLAQQLRDESAENARKIFPGDLVLQEKLEG